ncbi:hexitol phosphatase HxpB [Pseudoalteromonas luteoviolacea]|uniref:HAD family hydrolase n=1 Tax=Pseudoalteromonas luteoviolacea S4054 TaxID=1129367 RepID=A0A0F6AAW5_9GAMM|nr:hexitol phosphatase HxpB [Pseudoalteromonas luteoviolacea]AOT08632.1 HAD family hydrolase [Pseudoalteromonas luteoviolacea]AOT13547.1 HAD family hydrolase [Pseudoalteromonas luteoviolacea]AOT18460.1 HAD family hydrolase [Pseudoalteromonas luteoviolacea]KKE82544.1 hypothetical protein N479_18220 [Pseudoalteromonas luteoviolacea S4054]KZN72081.1 hypothetical protein N481_16855 [Pseudoalteromonas luteoviolacea S4047-1]
MIEAVIFDMDGTLIDSEPMWKEAEKQVFSSLGVNIKEELAAKTASMTTIEAAEFWYKESPWVGASISQVADKVVNKVSELIVQRGEALPGVHDALDFLTEKQVKIGLATNAPNVLISVVLNKLKITHYFSVCCSSEYERLGKPSPDVYLSTAAKLQVAPQNCLAVEDSVTGLCAAKAANMCTLVVPHKDEYHSDKFARADYKLVNLTELKSLWLDRKN